MTDLPQGYEPHEIPADYTGPLFIEGQLRRFAEAETVRLRKAARMALDALESLQGGCTDSDDGTVEALTVHCPEVIIALRAALGKDK